MKRTTKRRITPGVFYTEWYPGMTTGIHSTDAILWVRAPRPAQLLRFLPPSSFICRVSSTLGVGVADSWNSIFDSPPQRFIASTRVRDKGRVPPVSHPATLSALLRPRLNGSGAIGALPDRNCGFPTLPTSTLYTCAIIGPAQEGPAVVEKSE